MNKSPEVYAFEYDNQNNIKKYNYTNGNQKTEIVFNYADNKVTQILSTDYVNGSSNFTTVYTVTYEGTAKVRLQSPQGENIVYNLDGNGYVTSEVIDGDVITYSYDAKGNITKVNDGETTTQFVYSSYKGIFSGIKSSNKWILHLLDEEGFVAQLKNAVLTTSSVSTDGTYTSVSTYEGFVSDYPTKWNLTLNGETTGTESSVYTITYK